MFYLDKLIYNTLYKFCTDIGLLFGLTPGDGAWMLLIIVGLFLYAALGGRRRNKC